MSAARDTAAPTGPRAAQSKKENDSPPPLLEMQGIVKRFGGTTALNGVDFEANTGEIHALLGENGAGKSTLMHVLSGLMRPDAGVIRLEGTSARVDSPRVARALGIAMVHQHFTLVPAFTVAENLALDSSEPSQRLRYSPRQAATPALERAAALGWNLQPEARVSELSVGVQQRVEIVKALATEARLLIFDEPTAVLGGDEVEELFGVLRRLREEGSAVILIAHKLAEILAVADRVTVLRRGNRVASCPVAETNVEQLAAWMIGVPSPPAPFPVREGGDTSLPVDNQPVVSSPNQASSQETHNLPSPPSLTGKGAGGLGHFTASNLTVLGDRGEQAIRGLSLTTRRGEIVGIGGVDGNGQTELAEALVGLRPLQSGSLTWEGKPFQPGAAPPLAYIPQDRRRAGLALTMTIEENLLFYAARESAFRVGPFLRRGALRRLAVDLIRQFDIRTPGPDLPASALSGGNQQKIIIARALRSEPEWIVAVNPTRGLDIGATRFVHEQLRLARERGAAIVFFSTDLDELALLADRTAILSGGQLTETRLSDANRAEVGLLLGGLGGKEKAE